MSHNGYGAPSREPFGQVAVRKGYVNQQQVQDALKHQRFVVDRGEKHKLIGMIMLEMGSLGTTELIEVLKELDLAHTPATGTPTKTSRRLSRS